LEHDTRLLDYALDGLRLTPLKTVKNSKEVRYKGGKSQGQLVNPLHKAN
jgi:hypothetical protein